MISYELYCQIRLLYQERGLNFAQIARELHLDEETVAKWARAKSYSGSSRTNTQRKSKLDSLQAHHPALAGTAALHG